MYSIIKPTQVSRMNFELANPEFCVPFKPYYLRETSSALDEIRRVTNNLQNVPEQFKQLQIQLSLPGKANMVYGQFDAPANIAVIGRVNGEAGFFLKKTICETGIDFIWFHTELGQYLFWGSSKERVIDAMNKIRSRIIKYVKYFAANQQITKPKECLETPPPRSESIYGCTTTYKQYDFTRSPSPSPDMMFRSISGENYMDSDDDDDDDDE